MLRTCGGLWDQWTNENKKAVFHTTELYSCNHVPWMIIQLSSAEKKYFYHDSNNILWVLYNWQLLPLGRVWILTLLIMSNTRCQELDERWAVRGIELMSVPWGGCLSFGRGIVSRLTTFKIHQDPAVQQTTCSLKHIRHMDSSTPKCC